MSRRPPRNVFEKHGQRIAREDAKMPAPIRDVLSPRPRAPYGTSVECKLSIPVYIDGES